MKILLIDDQPIVLQIVSRIARQRGHKVETATTHEQAFRHLESCEIEAVLLDLHLQDRFDYAVLEQACGKLKDRPVVVMTKEASVEMAVDCMRRGAFDYIIKPLVGEKLEDVFLRIEKRTQLRESTARAERKVGEESDGFISFETEEPAVREVYQMAMKAARTEANMVLLGPSGTGKTVLARNVHAGSQRREHPFVVVHCPSLSAELLESELFGHVKGAFTGAVRDTWGHVARAHKGTLFLDEIGDLPLEIQAKLLRLLQEGEYERVGEAATHQANVRVIAATNRNLTQLMEQGLFRDDLYYRLNVVSLTLPALCDRPRDLLLIARRFVRFLSIESGNEPKTLTPEAEKAIMHYPWPGNFRELRNALERAIIFSESDQIGVEDLPDGLRTEDDRSIKPGHPITLQELEKEHIRLIINREATIKDAAEILGIDAATLYRKRKKMNL